MPKLVLRSWACLAATLVATAFCRAGEPPKRLPLPPLARTVTVRIRYANPAIDGLLVAGGGPWRLPAVRATRAEILLRDGRSLPLVDGQGKLDAATLSREDSRTIRVVLQDPEAGEILASSLNSALLRTPLEQARFVEPASRPWALQLTEASSSHRGDGALPWAQVLFVRERGQTSRTLELPLDEATRSHLREAPAARLRIDLRIPYDAGPGGDLSARGGSRFLFPGWVVVPGVDPDEGVTQLLFALRQMHQEQSLSMHIDPDWVASGLARSRLASVLQKVFTPTETRNRNAELLVLAHPNAWVRIDAHDLRPWPRRPEAERRAAVLAWLDASIFRSATEWAPAIELIAPGSDRSSAEIWRASLRGAARESMAAAVDRSLMAVAQALNGTESRGWASADLVEWHVATDDIDMFGYRAAVAPVHALAWVPLLGAP